MINTSYIRKWLKLPIHYLYSGENYMNAKAQEIMIDYSSDVVNLSVSKRPTIICMFDDKIASGGLADRLRGIVSMYMYAKQLEFDFKIFHEKGFSLSDFLIPNKIDWIIKKEDILYNRNISKVVYVACGNYPFEDSLTLKHLNNQIKKETGFIQYHVYPSLRIGDKQFSELYNELFSPSELLSSAINEIHKQISEPYVTCSFRFVELLGDFKDTIHITLHEEEKQKLIERCIEELTNIHKKEKKKIVVTSDSSTFLNEVCKLDFVCVLPGKIGHIDYDSTYESHLKTFADFYTIATAHKAYMVRCPIMYNSGFARRAAMINNIPFEEYKFNL
ncbi:hypothetical protein H6A61_12415 [Bacteroides caecigallinarum]|uniref:hypothetical protein n=1 Tax=Bacteroides caecigallinarum TaxID=1411144 RepID=UPI001957F9C3|nr:hypothetical protein [Bacteroides caecigallinarum]MBM6961651.1 hypothetical protein [Bacteroides caecigallinarum]